MLNIAQFDKKCSASSGDRIKIYPDILLSAARGNNGGAAKLWTLAKHANPGGCGSIPNKALRQFVINDLKIKRGTYDQWLAQALHIKLLERSGDNLKRAGLARAAVILGVEHVKRPVNMPLDKFVKKGWLAWVWAGWLLIQGHLDKPISRAALRDLSGIPERTQLEYEKKAGVINHHNFAKHEGINTIEQFYDLSIIKGRPIFDYQGQVLERLPNSRELGNEHIQAAPKGRTRRANSRLKDLLNTGGQDHKQTITRRYCQGEKQAEAVLKRITNLKNKGAHSLPGWIYQAADIKGYWHAIPA